MEFESLDQLRSAYANWRKKKRHIREAVPAELLEPTRRAATRFGTSEVSRAIKMDWERMSKKMSRSSSSSSKKDGAPPAYSRFELLPPAFDNRILAAQLSYGTIEAGAESGGPWCALNSAGG